jgi:CubicO group peptidase (beta-lactamase class C family)
MALDAGVLEELRSRLGDRVASGEVPGLVAAVRHEGETMLFAVGRYAQDGPPIEDRALFRVASLSKPIIGVLAMMLVEEGLCSLDEPIERLLPELASRRVLRTLGAELSDTVAARREITLRHLLSCQAGFGIVLAPRGAYPILRAEERLGLRTLGTPWPPPSFGRDEWLARFATLPLMDHPGEVWRYHTGVQLASFAIERAVGEPIAEVLRSRLTGPLRMTDTMFVVEEHDASRFTTAYAPTGPGGALEVLDRASDGFWRRPQPFDNGAAWLVMSAGDLLRFSELLERRGEVGGRRLLSERSVDELTSPQISAAVRSRTAPFLEVDQSWGLAMAVPAPRGTRPGSRGFGWVGGTGTTWYHDPATGLTGVLLTTRALTSPEPHSAMREFWEIARRAPRR